MTVSAAELAIGTVFTSVLTEGLTRTQIVQYAGASGDYNPVHTDEIYATRIAGQPGVFAHGMLTMAMTGRLLTDHFDGAEIVSFGGRFTAQVWPGDALTAVATVFDLTSPGIGAAVVHVHVLTRNQAGVTVFTGTASVRLSA